MKIELEFFGDLENSRTGTIAACIAISVFIGFDILYYLMYSRYCYYKSFKNIRSRGFLFFAFLVKWLLLGSAIGVAKPDSELDAFVYGLMIGFVVGGVMVTTTSALNKNVRLFHTLIELIYISLVTGFASYVTYVSGVRLP